MKNKDTIIFSESVITELKKRYEKFEIEELLGLLQMIGILNKIGTTKEEYEEADRLRADKNVPFVDCLNAVQARNHNALMVTQDKHFFAELKDIVKSARPQELFFKSLA